MRASNFIQHICILQFNVWFHVLTAIVSLGVSDRMDDLTKQLRMQKDEKNKLKVLMLVVVGEGVKVIISLFLLLRSPLFDAEFGG